MSDLRARADAFLRRSCPAGREAPGIPIYEVIARYLAGGPWNDPLVLSVLSRGLSQAATAADGPPGERQEYFRELVAVLRGIRGELAPLVGPLLDPEPASPGAAAPPPELVVAAQTETERRSHEIRILVNVLQPDPRYQPWLLTDRATALDVADVTEDMIRDRLERYFGRRLPFSVLTPLWQLVDALKARFPGWPEDWSPDGEELNREQARPGQVHPNGLESAVLARLVNQVPGLRPLVERLWVVSREFTGAGSFTRFQRDGHSTHGKEAHVHLDAVIRVPGVPSGMGAVLFLRGDQPEALELFTRGDEYWDGVSEGFLIENS